MSQGKQTLLRLCCILCVYICFVSGSFYSIYNDTNAQNKKASLERIISNENRIVNYLRVIHDAQNRYHAVDWDEDGVKTYAQFIVHLWQTVDKQAFPIKNRFIPKKVAFAMGKSRAMNGYYFLDIRLKESGNMHQSPQSRALDLKHEWAITAAPADYGHTGMLTFIVSNSGKIYAQDIKNRTVQSLPEQLIRAEGWKEIKNKNDIILLHP
ncbi:MAG: DUF2950 family protein [bacterium]